LLNEPDVRKHVRKYLEYQDYDVWDQEEKEIIPGVRADLIASTKGKIKKVIAIETKGSQGKVKEAVGQASTYQVSDLISESYVAIPQDLLDRAPYVKEVCDTVGVGLLSIDDKGEVHKMRYTRKPDKISSVSLWGNRRNGAPDTTKVTDLKLVLTAVSKGIDKKDQIIDYIQRQRPKTKKQKTIKKNYATVFIEDATQIGLIIKRLDGSYTISPLGKTILEINSGSDVTNTEKQILKSFIFNFPVAYMIYKILKENDGTARRNEIFTEGIKLENEISSDGVFQTAFRKKYHLNQQRLDATLDLMKDLEILEKSQGNVKLIEFR
jgi:hypothetical protein